MSLEDFLLKQSRKEESFMSVASLTRYITQNGIDLSENMRNKLSDIFDPSGSS